MCEQSPPVLVVDDEPEVCQLIESILDSAGLRCATTTDPLEAKELIARREFSVLVADVTTDRLSGLDLLAYVRKNRPACRVVLITGVPNMHYLAEALRLGAYDYIEKPFNRGDLTDAVSSAINDGYQRSTLLTKVTSAVREWSVYKQACMDSTSALVRAAEAKDPYTRRHSEHVMEYTEAISADVGVEGDRLETIRVASLMHDIGKIGVPDDILLQNGPLSDEEFALVRRHPDLGADILREIPVFTREALLVRHHHERWDGLGYPDGLSGANIPFGSRVMNIADAIDAMLSPRSYKNAYGLEKVLSELRGCAGSQFDPDLADAAAKWCRANGATLTAIPA